MEAIVLVGGHGTRLRPLTLTTPKPMVPVANVPFVAHQLLRLRDAGATHVVLATSYRAEVFTAYFGDGARWGLQIDYVTEAAALGTGGGIRNAAAALSSAAEDPVVVLNGDVLSAHDIALQVELHRQTRADVTLHLVAVEDARPFGCVPTDDDGRVTAFLEKMPEPVTNEINAGCYVMRRAVIDAIPPHSVVSVERQTFPELLTGGAHLHGYVESGYWLDVGAPAAIVQASADLVRGVLPSSAVATTGPALVADDAACDGARLDGGTAVGPGAVVAAGAVVDGSIVGAGAVVDADAEVVRSVVGAGAHIGAGSRLVDAVVGDGARIGRRNELLAGARVWPQVELPDVSIRFSTDA